MLRRGVASGDINCARRHLLWRCRRYRVLRVPNPWPLLAAVFLSLGLLTPAAVHAADGVSYSPSPAYLGSSEQFSACGFQPGETTDLVIDNANVAQGTAGNDGCVDISQQTSLDMDPTTHPMSIKGETSAKEQIGVLLVMPPMIPGQPAPVLPGGVAIVSGQYFAPLHMLTLIPGGLSPSSAAVGPDGMLNAQIPVLPNIPPGTYPVQLQDSSDPVWIAKNQPALMVTVLPVPSDAPASAQPAGNWTLNAASTLKRDDGKVNSTGSSTTVGQFSVSGNQVKGQGQLSVTIDMSIADANCHGQSSPVPFTITGTADGGMFHLTLTGATAGFTITVTCNNGFSLPAQLPAGSSTEPFDIQATDGQTADFDGSNQFLMVPPSYTGHTHVVLNKA